MKTSDVGFFTRHVEKIILGLGVLGLLVIVFLFVIGDPYAVTLRSVSASKQLSPQEVEEVLNEEADRLRANLLKVEQFDTPPIPDYHENFARSYQEPVFNGSAEMARLGEPVLPTGLIKGSVGPTTPYRLASVPMPLSVKARADHGLMDLTAFENPDVREGYARMIDATTPADFRYASVEAVFDLAELHKRYAQVPAAYRVPDHFVRNSLMITGVFLIRQTQDPISRRWGDDTVIEVLPDQLAFLPDESRTFTDASAERAVERIKNRMFLIARPEFPPLVPGSDEWRPPSAAETELTLEERRELNDLNKKIERLRNTLERYQERQRRGQDQPTRPRERTPTRQPDFDDFGPGGPMMNEPVTQPRERRLPNTGNTEQERVQRMQQDLNEAIRRRDLLRQGLDPEEVPDMQADPYGDVPPGMMDMPPGMMEGMPPEMLMQMQQEQMMMRQMDLPGVRQGEEAEALPAGQVRVWAHDLTVEPGRTYRYKLVVSVLNPLFHKKRLHEDQVEQNMHRISLVPDTNEIARSGWSEAVHIDPEFYFFVVAGNPDNQTAKVEIYRIFNGEWRRAEFDVQPGDPIGGLVEVQLPGEEVRKVDMRVDAFMVDMISVPVPGNAVGTTRMLYLDPLTNRIASRDVSEDRNNDERDRLQFEVQQAEANMRSARAAQ